MLNLSNLVRARAVWWLQDLTGCSLRVADHVYHFDDGYNLAKATSVEIHAGPDAKDIKKLPIADHDKVNTWRCRPAVPWHE